MKFPSLKLLFCVFLTVSSLIRAEGGKSEAARENQAEAISAESQSGFLQQLENDSSGSILFRDGEKTEKLIFGEGTEYFAYGLVFDAKRLKGSIKELFGDQRLYQIVFGIREEKRAGRTPQFGMLSVATSKPLAVETSFPLGLVEKKASQLKERAVLMISSPSVLESENEESRLKRRYFGQAGNLTLQKVGTFKQKTSETLKHNVGGRNLQFRKKTLKLQFNSFLVSPFNPIRQKVEALIELPVLEAQNQAAIDYIDQLALQGLGIHAGAVHLPD